MFPSDAVNIFVFFECYGAGLRIGWSEVRVPTGAGNFSLHHRVQTGSGAHPTSYPMGNRDSFPGGKAAREWSCHSPPSKVEIRNACSYTSTPQYAFMAWCSVEVEGQLYLYLYGCSCGSIFKLTRDAKIMMCSRFLSPVTNGMYFIMWWNTAYLLERSKMGRLCGVRVVQQGWLVGPRNWLLWLIIKPEVNQTMFFFL
jgi:hypothetical protein